MTSSWRVPTRITAVLIAAIAATALAQTARAEPASKLTTEPAARSAPRIDGESVFWLEGTDLHRYFPETRIDSVVATGVAAYDAASGVAGLVQDGKLSFLHVDEGRSVATSETGMVGSVDMGHGAWSVWAASEGAPAATSLFALETYLGGTPRKLPVAGMPYALDGTRLAFVRHEGAAYDIYVFDLATDVTRKVASSAVPVDLDLDGDRLVWASRLPTGGILYVTDAGSASSRTLAMPGYAPSIDGDLVVWSDIRRNGDAAANLWSHDFVTDDTRLLSASTGARSPDVRTPRIAWLQKNPSSEGLDVWKLDFPVKPMSLGIGRVPMTPNGDGWQDFAYANYTIEAPARVDVRVYDAQWRHVGTAYRNGLQGNMRYPRPASYSVRVTGTGIDGRPLADGMYNVLVRARNGAGTGSRSDKLFIDRGLLVPPSLNNDAKLVDASATAGPYTAAINYELTKPAWVTIRIWDPATGKLVKKLSTNGKRAAGRRSQLWDGTDSLGRPVQEARYVWSVFTTEGGSYWPTTGWKTGDVEIAGLPPLP